MTQTITSQVLVCQVDHGVLIAQFVRHEVTSESAVHDVEKMILARMTEAERGVVVDCSQLTGHVTSCLLNMLVKIRSKAERLKMPFAISGLNGFLEEVFTMTNLQRVIRTCPSLADAVAEFGEFDDRERVRVDRRKENRKVRSEPKENPAVVYVRQNRRSLLILGGALLAIATMVWWANSGPTYSAEYQKRVERFW